ncbi:30S ribosomal protein S14 [Streptomyces sp. ID05-26A]|uniref:Small ribosomal subunit protein uS14 n=1 Tax=Lentzea pudingi TaxID=1789439 RepID=A0ABQ2IV50_9PSEU|nr:30S ribosomal protein S14 [Lentzea pudingi]MDX3658474.1 30S ribosomal protein S14 [Streptomyces sp. ID05-26A]GGN27121.1 30S ribosomal protein S14 [Lentzea pudingi]
MAKKSKIAADQRRRVVVARYAERRAELKEMLRHPETRAEALQGLQKLPRDASPTRLRNRDTVDGRPRAFNRKFGLSRVRLREMAHRGELPGVSKASW